MQIKTWIQENQTRALQIAFATLALLTIPAYIYARTKMTMILGYLYIIESNITLNFVLLLAMCGYFTDQYCKSKNITGRKAWLIFLIQFTVVILFFRFIGGFKTILG